MTIKDIIYKAEKKFKRIELRHDVWGFQIQLNTKFLRGISRKEIDQLQLFFGFDFPWEYREMLLNSVGLDKAEISIDPNGKNELKFQDSFYQYPRDIEKSKWLVQDINTFKNYAEAALTGVGFDASRIVGYIPIYSHRALVVFEDKYLSPVISVWGSDIILYGSNLKEYLKNEFIRI